MSWGTRRLNRDHQLDNGKRQAYKKKKKTGLVIGSIARYQDNQGHDQGLGEDREMGTNDRVMGRLNVGFVNCSGWWSREVDLKLVIGLTCWG